MSSRDLRDCSSALHRLGLIFDLLSEGPRKHKLGWEDGTSRFMNDEMDSA
jgi:hypothetical protein